MSTQHLTDGERLTAAHVVLEELTQQLVVQCRDAHYLVAALEAALAEASISARLYPSIAEPFRMLRALFADYAVAEDFPAPTLAEIAKRIGNRRDLFEE